MLSVRKFRLDQVGRDFGADWQRLLETAGVDLSMSHEWFRSTVQARKLDARAHVFAAYRSDKLVGVLPCIERKDRVFGVPLRALESPGSHLVAYHPEVVVDGDPEAVLGAIVDECSSSSDVFVVPNVSAEGASAAAVRALARARGLRLVVRPGHASPYLSITSSWDQFVAGKDKKFRYKVRNALRDLQAVGQVSEEWFTTEDKVDEFASHMLRIEANSWKAGAGMAVSGNEMERDYYQRLLPFLVARDAMRGNILYLDRNPVAYSLCYVWRGAFRQLKTSFDDRCARYSVGSAVLQHAIKRAYDEGACEFDFLGDAMPHKNQWATGVREHETMYLFQSTWRGIAIGSARQCVQSLRTRFGGTRSVSTRDVVNVVQRDFSGARGVAS